jgi:hypothetical protein
MGNRFIQVSGPFIANEEIFTKVKELNSDASSIKKIGIQAPVKDQCKINGEIFEIGKTGSLQLDDVKVTSIYFLQDEADDALIDCIVE